MEPAIHIRGAMKQYDSNTKVLQGLNITVQRGSIYALLGASGCGKTTLLNCIVGRRKLDAGEITVLGGKPGSISSGVPGPRIGFMPQDIGLIGEFSVKGAIFYFGCLAGMSNKQIEERYKFLSQLLDLPPSGRLIKNLSGGQQRRVSFAAALVHQAELLILDEPTVGLDPELRNKIWEHLVNLTKNHDVTVVITTHYIEEARQANMVGLMRQGRLLAENTPNCLLDFYKCSSLEEVFLKLSIQQSKNEVACTSSQYNDAPVNERPPAELPEIQSYVKEKKPYTPRVTKFDRMKALLWKNYLGLLRNKGEMIFVVVFPIIQITLLFLAIGRHPDGLHLAIVNNELGNYTDCSQYLIHENQTGCVLSGLSCKFLSRINDSIAMKDFYQDPEMALDAVRRGEAVGALLFAANFSDALLERWESRRDTSTSTFDSSDVDIYMDMTDEQTGILMQAVFVEEFKMLGNQLAGSCDFNEKTLRIPMRFNDPVYGTKYPRYVNYVAPGYIISVMYFLSTVLTTTVIIKDRNEGIWDRNLIAGVTVDEIIWSHLLCQFTCVIVYAAEVVFLTLVVFGLHCEGSILTYIFMVILQGVSGMMYGLLISVACSNYTMGIFIASGSLLPFVCLNGVIWPIEGMPTFLRYISFMMPYTMANLSLSNIFERGWNLLQPQVFGGFLVSAVWIILEFLVSITVLHFSK